MKSAIFYGSPTKLTNAHKPVFTPTKPPHGAERQPEYYVRMKVVNGDELHALDKAKPMTGEILLNSVLL